MEHVSPDISGVDILIDKKNKFVKIIWKEIANNLTPEEGFELTEKVFNRISEYALEYILSDNQKSIIAYTKQYRERIIKSLIAKVLANKGLKRFALVMSQDLSTQISQMIFENELKGQGYPFEISFFHTSDQAEQWLMSK